MPVPNSSTVCQAALPLPPNLARLPEDSLQVYGPVVANQCDHAGIPIQRYVTILVHCKGGAWLLRREVTSVNNRQGDAQLVEMKITADDAHRWLADNQLVLESATKRA